MLCEKCGRREARWGGLCKECETVNAMEDRKAELFSITRAIARSTTVMTVCILALTALCVVAGVVIATWYVWLLTALSVLCTGLCAYEWQYWQRTLSRLNNGEWVQTAYDLLHHPKGLWKRRLHDPDSFIFHTRRSVLLNSFRVGLNKLYDGRLILEQLTKTEE